MIIRPLLVALALLCAGLTAPPARAQEQSAVTLEVQPGYDGAGSYRVGHWFPVAVVAANSGADLRGTLEWRFPGDSEPSFHYELDLPRGARKGLLLPVVTTDNDASARVALVVDGEEVASAQTRLAPINPEEVGIGVLSTDRSLLNSLGAARIANNTTTRVTHLDPELLPEDAALLAGLDVIFVHDLASANLTGEQRAALGLWAHLGGQLVVSGGPQANRTVPGLDDLLPVEVGPLRPGAATASLDALAARSDLATLLPTTTASAFTLRPGAVRLDRDGLLTAHELGAGRVVFAAFDLAALRTWGGEAALWEQVLRLEPRMALGASFRTRSENLLRDALNLPALQLPSTGLLLLLMGLYIVVVGPVNFLVLRRLRRIELAWVTTPLLVALFTAGAYGTSLALRGTSAQITQLAIVQSFERLPGGQTTAFLGVFSPQRRSYRLDFSPETLVTPATFESFQLRNEPVTGDGASTGMRTLLIDVSALRTVMAEQPKEAAPAVESTLEVDPDTGVRGEVRLIDGPALRDALIVLGASAQKLGDLQPGGVAQVDLEADRLNFPDQIALPSSGVINRRAVLNNLFGYDRFAIGGPTFQGDKGLPERDGVYLLGWVDQGATEARLDGEAGQRQGETLYIIRLGR